jgi:hypothetical protein
MSIGGGGGGFLGINRLPSIGSLIAPGSGGKKDLDPLGLFDPPKPIPPPAPLPPPVTRKDPAVKDARTNAIKEAKRRRGRKSTILTSGRGVSDDQLGVTRPEAKSATTLGG